MIFETLLYEALKAGAGALTKAGLEKAGGKLAQWLDKDKKKLVAELHKSWEKAAENLPDGEVRNLIKHNPFQQEVVISLLDPVSGFDLEKAAVEWSEKLPVHRVALRKFFSDLQFIITGNDQLGPIFQRYRDLRLDGSVDGLPTSERELVQKIMVENKISISTINTEGGAAIEHLDVQVHRDFLLNIYQIYQQPAGNSKLSKDQFKQVLGKYLLWVYNAYSQARLYGLESLRTAQFQPVRKLNDVFVPLTLTRFFPLSRKEMQEVEKEGEDLFRRSVAYSRLIEQKQQESKPVNLKEILTVGTRLAIIGGAGSGKSTLLAYLAAALAQVGREGIFPAFELPKGQTIPIPLLVPLRYYREYLSYCQSDPGYCLHEPRSGTLVGFIPWYFRRRNPALEASQDFFDRLLLGGGCLLMLDGLDEVVSQEERGRVRQQVEQLINDTYPGNSIIVTARESGYRENAIFSDDFTRLDVRRLEKEQIAALVKNWCRQLFPSEVEERSEELMDAIGTINDKYEQRNQPTLISTPLMTTMVVSVKWGETELPRERASLYEAAVRVILQAQYIPEDDARKELVDWGGTWDEQRDWLSLLALEMHRGGRTGAVISQPQIEKVLSRSGVSQRVIQRFILATRQRGGLFEERGEIFQFVHLTFQEFLAARWLAKQRKDALLDLPQHLPDGWWREVLLLLYGFALVDYRDFAREYMEWLSSRDENPEICLAGLELAGAALLEIDKPQEEILRAQAEKLVETGFDWRNPCQASATLRARAGNTLAALGDPRFDPPAFYLPKEKEDLLGFVEIPAGKFLMGSDPGKDKGLYDDEKPRHEVELPAYYMARYPVTVAQFKAFAEETKCKLDYPDCLKGIANHPIVSIRWYEALKYCQWLTGKLKTWQGTPRPLTEKLAQGWQVTLPSEAEWEKAARGTDGSIYPWGDEFDANKANTSETGIGGTSAVGCFPGGKSPYDLLDMSGNVWQWTRSIYGNYPYPSKPDERKQREDLTSKESRILRGGSFYNDQGGVRCAYRYWSYPLDRHWSLGFRLVLSPA